MKNLFTREIRGWASWGKVYQSIGDWEPLAMGILEKEGLPRKKLRHCTPGTNAVFRTGDCLLKIFAPAASGLDTAPDYASELFGLLRAGDLGVPAPRLAAGGQIADKYLFRYLIMEYIQAQTLGEAGARLSSAEKEEIGRTLKGYTDRLNTPCERFNTRDPLEESRKNPRWDPFPESFNRERLRRLDRTVIAEEEKVYVHGDLNPDNLLLGEKLYVIDFADGLLAPPCYEQALAASELFQFQGDYMRGYFGGCSTEEIVKLCMDGLLIHDFGGDILRRAVGPAEELRSLQILQDRLRARIGEERKP